METRLASLAPTLLTDPQTPASFAGITVQINPVPRQLQSLSVSNFLCGHSLHNYHLGWLCNIPLGADALRFTAAHPPTVMGCSGRWWFIAGVCSALRSRIRLHTVDASGFGQSAKPPWQTLGADDSRGFSLSGIPQQGKAFLEGALPPQLALVLGGMGHNPVPPVCLRPSLCLHISAPICL